MPWFDPRLVSRAGALLRSPDEHGPLGGPMKIMVPLANNFVLAVWALEAGSREQLSTKQSLNSHKGNGEVHRDRDAGWRRGGRRCRLQKARGGRHCEGAEISARC